MKPKEGGMWGAGVHKYVYHGRVLPFPTASPLFCQLFDQTQQTYLQPTPGAIAHSPLTPSMTPRPLNLLLRADLVTEAGCTVKSIASGVWQTWVKIPTPLLTNLVTLGNVLDLLASGSSSLNGM